MTKREQLKKYLIVKEGRIKMKTYEEIIEVINDAPESYLPALLVHIVEICVQRKVFTSRNTLLTTINNVVRDSKKD